MYWLFSISCQSDDSDVDLIQVRQDEPETFSPTGQRSAERPARRNLTASHQPIVHFEGAVREPASPQEYDVGNELPKELSNPKLYVSSYQSCIRVINTSVGDGSG